MEGFEALCRLCRVPQLYHFFIDFPFATPKMHHIPINLAPYLRMVFSLKVNIIDALPFMTPTQWWVQGFHNFLSLILLSHFLAHVQPCCHSLDVFLS